MSQCLNTECGWTGKDVYNIIRSGVAFHFYHLVCDCTKENHTEAPTIELTATQATFGRAA